MRYSQCRECGSQGDSPSCGYQKPRRRSALRRVAPHQNVNAGCMSVGKTNLTLAVRLRRVATTNQTRGQAHGVKQPQTKFFNSGYSSVGRASDCRFCRHQMVPGSIPGGRIYGYGGHVRQELFQKKMLSDTFAHACTAICTCAALRKTRRRTLSRKSYPHAMHEAQNRKILGAPLPLSLTATVV